MGNTVFKVSNSKRYIDIRVEDNDSDYHDLVIEVLRGLSSRLSGGHYEPLSDRDVLLSHQLNEFIKNIKNIENIKNIS